MSVPHLDTRMIDGKRELLFGPCAGFSTKFLKNGSYLDLPKSLQMSNLAPMLMAGLHNIPLTKYLVQQVMQSPEDRLFALREYFLNAQMHDWEPEVAGQRVQVIKKDDEEGGRTGVRHRDRKFGGWQHCGSAGCITRVLHCFCHHARPA